MAWISQSKRSKSRATMKPQSCFPHGLPRTGNANLGTPWGQYRHGCDPPIFLGKFVERKPHFNFRSDFHQSVRRPYFLSPLLSSTRISLQHQPLNDLGQPSVLWEGVPSYSHLAFTNFPSPEAPQQQEKKPPVSFFTRRRL